MEQADLLFLHVLAQGTGRNAQNPFELPGEVALVGESAGEGDVRQRSIRGKECAGVEHPPLGEVGMRRHTQRAAENP